MPLLEMLSIPKKRAKDALELEPQHLEGFRRSQQVAYACVRAVAEQLREGITELEVAGMMEGYLRDHGINQYFHRAFVWFGDRTAFRNFKSDSDFGATHRALEPGMPAILDIAPVIDGYSSDVGYACRIGENALQDQMIADLEPYRDLILQGVLARKNLSQIYWDVDLLIQKQGYENRHRRYGGRVLAHRVNFVPPEERSEKLFLGFGPPAIKYLQGRAIQAMLHKSTHISPIWNDRRSSDHPAEPGLWAVEPHLGFRDMGVKWEELLVVTETGAFWLDDDLPHVRHFKSLKAKAPRQESPREVYA